MWQAVETGSTGRGIPDLHYCFPGGVSGWIEAKKTTGWAVSISPEQIAWNEQYTRMGGRCFIAVRRQGSARGIGRDELWLFEGNQVRALSEKGLKCGTHLAKYEDGPAKWDWIDIIFFIG